MIGRLFSASALLLFSLCLTAQELPDTIRGYKVHRPKAERTAALRSAGPVLPQGSKLLSISPLGVKFEAEMSIARIPQDGRVDFLAFHDFTVNGVPVDIEEYTASFGIRKNEPVVFPKPANIFISTPHIARAAWTEMRDSRPDWLVQGRVFVFGRFKRFGMTFKRVVPVDVAFSIKNPIH
jgi:hypothetical protein